MNSRITTLSVDVGLDDCDPSGFVPGTRAQSWLEAASRHFFEACGVLPHHPPEPRDGVVGVSLLEQHARFVNPATYGERLTITTRVSEWRPEAFVQNHVVTRGDDLICESLETRAFVAHAAGDARRLCVVPVSEGIRAQCR